MTYARIHDRYPIFPPTHLGLGTFTEWFQGITQPALFLSAILDSRSSYRRPTYFSYIEEA